MCDLNNKLYDQVLRKLTTRCRFNKNLLTHWGLLYYKEGTKGTEIQNECSSPEIDKRVFSADIIQLLNRAFTSLICSDFSQMVKVFHWRQQHCTNQRWQAPINQPASQKCVESVTVKRLFTNNRIKAQGKCAIWRQTSGSYSPKKHILFQHHKV